MYFTVEEENMIGMYHKSDRRRTAGAIQAVLPEVNEDMAALARQALDKLEATQAGKSAGRGGYIALASGAFFRVSYQSIPF